MAPEPLRPHSLFAGDPARRLDPLQPALIEAPTLTSADEDSAQPKGLRQLGPRLDSDCWFLCGPTAAGKTSLAIDLAGRLEAEIISVDSMAVYKGLDIGTAKPSLLERSRVPHHLIDIVNPSESYSVAHWLTAADQAVELIRSRGKRILFVGGTPLYLRALRNGLALLPAANPEFRRQLVAEVASMGVDEPFCSHSLHAKLVTIDPPAAARIHPNDMRRIIRALEVAHATGRPLSESFAPAPHPVFQTQMMIVDLSRRLLISRIERRVKEMFSRGLVAEVEAASALPGGIGFTARQATGYAQTLDLLAGRLTLNEAIAQTQQATRQLAKRQLTWLRSFKDAIWITA